MTEREIKIEDWLTAAVEALGGLCIKIAPLSFVGLPDRLILLPGGRIGFLELKRPGKEPTAVQAYWIDRLQVMGFTADWADSRDDCMKFLERGMTA